MFIHIPRQEQEVRKLASISSSTDKAGSFITPSSDPIRALVDRWRSVANEFRYRGADSGAARAHELCAEELQAALTERDSRLLSISEAAALTGRHRDTIGKALGSGRITNYGEKHRPRVRYGDVLAQFPPVDVALPPDVAYDGPVDARVFLGTRRGEIG